MDYTTLVDSSTLTQITDVLKSRNINSIITETRNGALEMIKKIIPIGSKVYNGSSTTLKEIGYIDYLKSKKHGWINFNEQILIEKDYVKQSELRRKALIDTDYFLTSMNAVTKNGLLVTVDATGSRTGAIPFAAKKLLIVIGTQKIVSTLEDALTRIREYVLPLEDARMQKIYNMHTSFGKWVILERETNPERTTVIFVKEKLGF
jgi:hypothetical protein